MDEKTLQHSKRLILGQEQYEELQHVLAAHHYTKIGMIDTKDALAGVYKIERWTADGRPPILVTVGDDGLIELWASPELWGGGTPHGSGNAVAHLDDLLTARRPA